MHIVYIFLETSIKEYLEFFRTNWPEVNISPKLHMMEDHMIPFLRQWRVGFGFYGEQGGESIHHEFKQMKNRYSNIKNPVDRLQYLMNQHLLSTFPKAQELKPEVKKRKLARNQTNK